MNFESKIEKKVSEALQPKTPEEGKLWEEIDFADKPIQNSLKRLNRILRDKFPESDIVTVDSCSGHVKTDGSVAYRATLPEYKDNKRQTNPALFLTAPLEKIDESLRGEISKLLNDIFVEATQKTNNYFQQEVLDFEEVQTRESELEDENNEFHDVLVFSCAPYLLDDKKAFEVLQKFWGFFGKALGEYDNLQVDESLSKEDFLPGEPGEGLVRPE